MLSAQSGLYAVRGDGLGSVERKIVLARASSALMREQVLASPAPVRQRSGVVASSSAHELLPCWAIGEPDWWP